MKEFLTFIRTEERLSNVMTSATGQPLCKKRKTFIGCYDGYIECARNPTQKNIALYLYKKHFCLICKPQAVSFSNTIE